MEKSENKKRKKSEHKYHNILKKVPKESIGCVPQSSETKEIFQRNYIQSGHMKQRASCSGVGKYLPGKSNNCRWCRKQIPKSQKRISTI